MPFVEAIRKLNSLKRRRVIRDYVLIGAVAATTYVEPVFTQDLDVIVLVDNDAEYLDTFRRLAQLAEGQEGMHQVFGGIPIQVFPSTTSPLYADALKSAQQARIGNLRVKVASPEHLIVLCLTAFRAKDKLRINMLLPKADMQKLQALIGEFDDGQSTLAKRFQSLL